MRGNLWSLLVMAVGTGVFLMVMVNEAVPDSPTSTTDAAAGVLHQLAPFAGMLVLLFGVGTLLTWSMTRSTF